MPRTKKQPLSTMNLLKTELAVAQEDARQQRDEVMFAQRKVADAQAAARRLHELLWGLAQYTRAIAVCELLDGGNPDEGYRAVQQHLDAMLLEAQNLRAEFR